MDRFRILSLDGGGIKGTFTASVLAALEEATGCAAAEHFDLITGTSTGGIIALGLGLGLPATEILGFYERRGPAIFPSTGRIGRVRRSLRQLFRPKQEHASLREALREVFGELRFGESRCRLVIPTYDAVGGRTFLLTTAHHPRFRFDADAPAVDVALATSAVPTYFAAAPFPRHAGASYVDGGVWANCPALVGVVEAAHFLQVPLDGIDMLSVGTSSVPFNIARHARSGVVQWNVGLVDLMFQAQVETALAQAGLPLDGRLHRIDVVVEPGRFALDNATLAKIAELKNLGRGVAVRKEHLDPVRSRFFNGSKAAPFVPVHAAASDTYFPSG